MTEFIQVPADAAGKRVNASLHNDGVNDIMTQVFHVGDRMNPDQHQSVDNKGAARVRFAAGSPDFDAFGRMSVSEPNLMEMYKFYQGDYATSFQKEELGGATIALDPVLQGIKLTAGTANADKSSYHSHRRFHYRPGNSMSLTWTMKIGDSGKVGVARRAGWITEDNGLFFEADGSDLYICIRNGNLATESRVIQSVWNGDRLNGLGGENNLSGATVDPTKIGIWWIDFQYLGGGAIRFGTYVNGIKVVCHTMGHYGELDRPYMSSAAMCFGFEQENTAITGSSSEMHVFCAVVTNDGYDQYRMNPITFSNTKTITSETFVPILSLRPSQLLSNGLPNTSRVVPQVVSVLSAGDAVEIRSDVDTPLVGDTWATRVGNTDVDKAATALTLIGTGVVGNFVGAGRSETINLCTILKIFKDGVSRHYDTTSYDYITISARLLSPGTSAVSIAVNALEVD